MKTLFGLLFYKLIWLDDIVETDEDGYENVTRSRGYYLIKKWYMWVIFAPIIILIKWIYQSVLLLYTIFTQYFNELFTYTGRYIQPKRDKMTLRLKLNYIKRLMR